MPITSYWKLITLLMAFFSSDRLVPFSNHTKIAPISNADFLVFSNNIIIMHKQLTITLSVLSIAAPLGLQATNSDEPPILKPRRTITVEVSPLFDEHGKRLGTAGSTQHSLTHVLSATAWPRRHVTIKPPRQVRAKQSPKTPMLKQKTKKHQRRSKAMAKQEQETAAQRRELHRISNCTRLSAALSGTLNLAMCGWLAYDTEYIVFKTSLSLCTTTLFGIAIHNLYEAQQLTQEFEAQHPHLS